MWVAPWATTLRGRRSAAARRGTVQYEERRFHLPPRAREGRAHPRRHRRQGDGPKTTRTRGQATRCHVVPWTARPGRARAAPSGSLCVAVAWSARESKTMKGNALCLPRAQAARPHNVPPALLTKYPHHDEAVPRPRSASTHFAPCGALATVTPRSPELGQSTLDKRRPWHTLALHNSSVVDPMPHSSLRQIPFLERL